MTRTDPPRLAVALLARFLPTDNPLAGDLLERYAATGSRLWLWRQVLMAIVLRGFVPCDRERPLGLADSPALLTEERSLPLAPFRVERLAATPVSGVGGLGLIALSVLLALLLSDVWLLLLMAVAGGVVLAVSIGLLRRRADTRFQPSMAAPERWL
jgi:hypothetical protein